MSPRGISYFSVRCSKYSVPSSILASRGVKSMTMNQPDMAGRSRNSSAAQMPMTIFPAGRAMFRPMPMPVRSFIIVRRSLGL